MVTLDEFKNAVIDLVDNGSEGTYHWILKYGDINYALVLGWSDGYEEIDNVFHDGTYMLEAKIAYQPYNSIMQCDYDVDWTMPYDKETMEVDDTSVSIEDYSEIYNAFDWLMKLWQRISDEI